MTSRPIQAVIFNNPGPDTVETSSYHDHYYDTSTNKGGIDGLEFYTSPYNEPYRRSPSSYIPPPTPSPPPSSTNIESFWSAFGTGGFADEPPLLEELGINFDHIIAKSLAVLNPIQRKLPPGLVNDGDMAGPLLYLFMFGVSLMLSGKMHFGYIYGVGVLGVLTIMLLFNLMSDKGIDGSQTASVLGYCLLPMVLLSAYTIILPLTGSLGFFLTMLAIVWSTRASSDMFTTMLYMQDQRFLVMYPIALFYASFALMAVY
ncbi:yip1-domain-containing protein [Lichtheimia corymbifera JMRC:FSU:9682]|uniref:Protein YIP n=1 Tax=Lichtheimia corymbifera JMRC:FSU:9682 TaxID=1263082 RepID=A0A068RKY1_9FUNG|nr:yip1-domain-containing protein [Lichtheimia corymbifera JMRC:FSU:9682]